MVFNRIIVDEQIVELILLIMAVESSEYFGAICMFVPVA